MPYIGKVAGNASAPMLVLVVCLTLRGLGMTIASVRTKAGARVRMAARQ